VIELVPGDWRVTLILDHAVEVICPESFPTRELAIEEVIERLEDSGVDLNQIGVGRVI
jgi:hypothetical protein